MRFVRKEAVQPGNVHLKGRSPYTSLGRDFLLCAATDADAVEWMCGTVGCNLPYRRDMASRCCEYEDDTLTRFLWRRVSGRFYIQMTMTINIMTLYLCMRMRSYM